MQTARSIISLMPALGRFREDKNELIEVYPIVQTKIGLV